MIAARENATRRIQIELTLLNQTLGFDQIYVQVKSLFLYITQFPDTITDQTIDTLLFVIQSEQHNAQKQCYFLYREAADALLYIAKDARHAKTKTIICRIQKLLLNCKGKRQRAVSEALGSLPVDIKGPNIHAPNTIKILDISFKDLLEKLNTPGLETFTWHGRTLRYRLKDNTIGCIKFATSNTNIKNLVSEIQWLLFLKKETKYDNNFFHIPAPVSIKNHIAFNVIEMPQWLAEQNVVSKKYPAIVFTTIESYYHYPNENISKNFDKKFIQKIYSKNATLLGELTSKGIMHTALIPLFHNRVQQNRRDDHGIYNWEQAGRLDQWLKSSKYPNFAASGLRDFEHLTTMKNPKKLRHFIGEHLLGFFLVVGSTFRNKEPDNFGWDKNNQPQDVRYNFDRQFFHDTMKQVIQSYYKGICGYCFQHIEKAFTQKLTDKLINAMGIDHHMEETLRIQDQNNMDDQTFYDFLLSRGHPRKEIRNYKRCEKDIILMSGPHLGGFNQQISVPELIEFLFCLSSMCISDRYLSENGLKGQAN